MKGSQDFGSPAPATRTVYSGAIFSVPERITHTIDDARKQHTSAADGPLVDGAEIGDEPRFPDSGTLETPSLSLRVTIS